MSLLRPLLSLQLRNASNSFPRLANPRFIAPLHTTPKRLQQSSDMASERPTGLKANKGIELLTWGTPNGVKASIFLEELKETYGKVGILPLGDGFTC
jgi:hypothetical protein